MSKRGRKIDHIETHRHTDTHSLRLYPSIHPSIESTVDCHCPLSFARQTVTNSDRPDTGSLLLSLLPIAHLFYCFQYQRLLLHQLSLSLSLPLSFFWLPNNFLFLSFFLLFSPSLGTLHTGNNTGTNRTLIDSVLLLLLRLLLIWA